MELFDSVMAGSQFALIPCLAQQPPLHVHASHALILDHCPSRKKREADKVRSCVIDWMVPEKQQQPPKKDTGDPTTCLTPRALANQPILRRERNPAIPRHCVTTVFPQSRWNRGSQSSTSRLLNVAITFTATLFSLLSFLQQKL